MDSWVKLYRKSIHGGWLRNQKLWTFWTYCLLKASHKIHKQIVGFQEVELQPGEFIFGLKQSSKELKMSVQSIRTCLQFLKKAGNLTIKTTNKYSIITIINWSTYQCNGYDINNQNNNPLTNHQQTTNKPLATNKNDKKGNNDKNEENNIEAKIQTQKEWKPVIKFLVEEYFNTLTDRQKTRFEKDREKFHGCCDKLMRIDGFSEEEIRKAVNFARHDHFWSSNFLSFSKLRQKNKDDVPWIEVFISKSGAKKQSKPAVGDTPDLSPEEMEEYYKDDLDRSKP